MTKIIEALSSKYVGIINDPMWSYNDLTHELWYQQQLIQDSSGYKATKESKKAAYVRVSLENYLKNLARKRRNEEKANDVFFNR